MKYFAIGDMAEIRNSAGEIMPPNVTIARISGTNAGKNILNLIKNKKLITCKPKLEGVLIALGGKYAAGNIYNLFHVKGRLAYEIKNMYLNHIERLFLNLLKQDMQN